MRSSLTRLVFRRILQNEPILHRDCSRRASSLLIPKTRTPAYIQRRTLFGFFQPKPKKLGTGLEDPGLDVLIDATKNLELGTRIPEVEDLVKAWTLFVKTKSEGRGDMTDIQAHHVLRIYRQLHAAQTSDEPALLTTEALVYALKGMRNAKTLTDEHASLALALHSDIQLQQGSGLHSLEQSDMIVVEDITVHALCKAGRVSEAWAMVKDGGKTRKPSMRQLSSLIEAYAELNDTDGVERVLEINDASRSDPDLRWRAAEAFAVRGNVQRARELADIVQLSKVYLGEGDRSGKSPVHLVHPLLRFCASNDEFEWGQSIIRGITEAGLLSKDKWLWEELFVWTLNTGKSVEEVDRMMEVMKRSTGLTPYERTINSLIRSANSRNDPYLAERLLALGKKWNVSPNATTYLLQMDYRLSVGDAEGARAAYQKLQGLEIDGDSDLPRVNKLIHTMCSSGRYDFNTIMGVVEDLSNRHKRFEPETVAALSVLHLQRDEYHDVADLLTTHVHQYSADERAVVRDTFAKFCLDRRNNIARVWDTYMIFQQVFDEADREVRTRIMNEFFTRRRADMAVHVFNHMRKHTREDTIPSTDTYAATLTGIAKLNDEQSLEIVHNAIKLDMNIDPSTKLSNALMYAYASCGEARYSTNFWIDICDSKEGPNHSSIMILFYACSKMSFGEKRAVSVWNQLGQLDVALSRDLIAMFLAALSGNQCYTEAYDVVEECVDRFGVEVDAVM
jgi:hypothetical protein